MSARLRQLDAMHLPATGTPAFAIAQKPNPTRS
jgi:hypothetical protein